MTMTDDPTMPAGDATSHDTAATDGPTEKKGKASEKQKKEKGGRSNLVPALVLAAGIAAGGYFMGGGTSGGEAEASATTEVPEIVEGPAVGVEPLTVNLAGGRYLRLGVTLQLTDAYEDAVEGDEGAELSHHDASRVRDLLIRLFGGRDAASLTEAEGRAAAKDELLAAADELLDGVVMDVYLTEFVIQ